MELNLVLICIDFRVRQPLSSRHHKILTLGAFGIYRLKFSIKNEVENEIRVSISLLFGHFETENTLSIVNQENYEIRFSIRLMIVRSKCTKGYLFQF